MEVKMSNDAIIALFGERVGSWIIFEGHVKKNFPDKYKDIIEIKNLYVAWLKDQCMEAINGVQ